MSISSSRLNVKQRRTLSHSVIHGVMLAVCALCILPLILIISASFTAESALVDKGYYLLPTEFSTRAYEFLLAEPGTILRAYGVSILVTVVGASVSLFLMSMLAYALSRRDFRWRRPLTLFVLFPLVFNAGLVPFYILMTRTLNLKDNLLALILPPLVIPFFTLLLRAYFMTLPRELIEAAKLDGASEWRIFFQIVVPLSTPALATVGLFSALFYWNDLYLSLLFINKPEFFNLQYLLFKIITNLQVMEDAFVSSGNRPPLQSVRMAMAVLAMGPMLFAFLFVQKYFVKGITLGGLKGE